MIRFEWDERKNQSNRKKHEISFEEAQSVFFDEQAIEFPDPDHSDEEARFLMLGHSYLLRVLIVCIVFDRVRLSSESFRRGKRPRRKGWSIRNEEGHEKRV